MSKSYKKSNNRFETRRKIVEKSKLEKRINDDHYNRYDDNKDDNDEYDDSYDYDEYYNN